MASNTKDTYLYSGTNGSDYTKVCDIKTYPDIFTPPPKLDATTLSDGQHVYIKDIPDTPDLVFSANYVEATYDTIKGYEAASRYYQVWFGAAGADAKFTFQAETFCTPKGSGVGAVREMEITLYPNTSIIKS